MTNRTPNDAVVTTARLAGDCGTAALRRFVVTLPLPPRELNPNASLHWTKKRRAAKQYRSDTFWECKRLFCWHGPPMQRVMVRLFWEVYGPQPPDLDNLNASFKAGLDGVADAGILADDSARVVTRIEADYALSAVGGRRRGGTVQVTIQEVAV